MQVRQIIKSKQESQITFDSEEEKTTTVELVTNNSLSFLKNK